MRPNPRRVLRTAGVAAIACASLMTYAQPVSWTTIVNNGATIPGTTAKFNSYNQPAISSSGMVVFRARGKVPTGGGGGGAAPAAGGEDNTIQGVFLRDMSGIGPVTSLATRGDVVPGPNNTMYNGTLATFTEFPSSPRIDAIASYVVTRGQSMPVYTYLAADGVTETRVGTSGVYASLGGGLQVGASLLGAVKEVQPDTSYALSFPQFSVPDMPAGTRFDVFPGSPTIDGTKVVFKGNFTDPGDWVGKTGDYFRDLVADGGKSPTTLIASTSTLIPNQPSGGAVRFGATAAPSAANGYAAFTGWDNEDAPTMGGIYRAPLVAGPSLQTLIGIGDQVPGEPEGATFTNFGEGLSMSEDGRYVAAWGTWGTETTSKLLICPTDGNKDLIAYCIATYPAGHTVAVPVHQGIFVADANTGRVIAIAKTGQDGITDLTYWTYSGAPPGVGGSEDDDREPPRWRSSAFAALASRAGTLYGWAAAPSHFQVAFKAARNGVDGIYIRKGDISAPLETAVETLLSTGQTIDPAAPAGSIVTAVGIERDGFRHENLAITVSMLYETVDTSLGWAGLYLAHVASLGPRAAAVDLASSPNPSNPGQTVTITATISGPGGAGNGSVSFFDGAVAIAGCGDIALSGGGTASCSTSALEEGTHSITAQYSGNAMYDPSNSGVLYQLVLPKPTPTVSLATSLNPSTLGQQVTFTASVSGTAGTATGSLDFRVDAAPISGCSAVALASGMAACSTTEMVLGTHSISAAYGGDANYKPATSDDLAQTVHAAVVPTNFALASAGGVASASSTYNSRFPPASLIDGERSGLLWAYGGGWSDATLGVYPDWVQVQFRGRKTIDHVVVFSLQDNYLSGVVPSDSLTFGNYGAIDFTVQAWSGSSWVVLGAVTGNNLVKRTVNFPAYTTDRIRVNVTASKTMFTRLVEIEAWGNLSESGTVAAMALRSSANPSTEGQSVTFSATVSGSAGTPTGTVAFVDAGVAITGCGALPLSGGVASCSSAALAAGVHQISVAYAGDATYLAGASPALTQTVIAGGAETNVALASAGTIASASSTYNSRYPVSSLIDGDLSGALWGYSGGWNDATLLEFPDWVQLQFSGTKTIHRVVVVSLQDDYFLGSDPADDLTFDYYGAVAFQVQALVGSSWVTLANITGNTLVKRAVTFTPVATNRLRVVVTSAKGAYTRLVEIEAWGH